MLNINNLNGFNRNVIRNIVTSVGTSVGSNTDGTTYTFSNVSVPDGDYIVLALMGSTNTSGMTINSVTVNEVATELTLYGVSFFGRGFAIIKHPKTATINIVVRTSASAIRFYIQLYTITGTLFSMTPTTSQQDTTSPYSISTAVPAGSVVFGVGVQASSATVSFTAGVTQDYGAAQEGQAYGIAGHYDAENQESARVVSASITSGILGVAVWR